MDIQIPTFVNPHLFWIISINKWKLISKIQRLLKQFYLNLKTHKNKEFQLYEIVGTIVNDKICCRAQIKLIIVDKETDTRSYLCWLVDYGTLIKTSFVFEISDDLVKYEHAAQQASLFGVAYAFQVMKLGVSAEIQTRLTEVPSSGATNQAFHFLNANKRLQFEIHKTIDGIMTGDIIAIDENGSKESLTKYLINKTVLSENDRLFERIITNINIYRDINLSKIYYICQTGKFPDSPSEKRIFNDVENEEVMDLNQSNDKTELRETRRKHKEITQNLNKSAESETKILSSPLSDAASVLSDESQDSMNQELSPNTQETGPILSARAMALLKRAMKINCKILNEQRAEKSAEMETTNTKNESQCDENSDSIPVKRSLALLKRFQKDQAVVLQTLNDLTPKSDMFDTLSNTSSVSDGGTPLSNNSSYNRSATFMDNLAKKSLEFAEKAVDVDEKASIHGPTYDVDPRSLLIKFRKEKLAKKFGVHYEEDSSTETSTSLEKDNKLVENEDKENDLIIEETKATTKKKPPEGCYFLPAGCTYSGLRSASRKTKTKHKKYNNTESDSDCPTKPLEYTNVNAGEDQLSTSSKDQTSNDEVIKKDSEEVFEVCTKETSVNHVGQLTYRTCSCKECLFWTEAEDWDNPAEFDEEESGKKVKKIVVKPELLFKEKVEDSEEHDGCENKNNNILSLDFRKLSKIQKQSAITLLVHGESIPTAEETVADLNIHKDIHRNIQALNYVKSKRIQAYSWPAITRGQHVIMVADAGSGKSMAYLPIMCSFIHERNERYNALFKMGGGPILVILCNSSSKCEQIYYMLGLIFKGIRSRVQLVTYPNSNINMSHKDILVTMPTVLATLLHTKSINFKRLCHFVLEDGEEIMKHHSDTLQKFLKLIQQMLKHRTCAKSVQLVICSEHWTKQLERICKKLECAPLVCIGNHLEAALYGRMEFSLRFLNTACKEQELKNILSDVFKTRKSIILCKNDEIEDIQTMLMLKGIDYTAITDDMERENILYLEQVWIRTKPGNYTVLICSDFLYNSMLNITDASLLIHYSLPETWSLFRKRFGSLLKNCSSPLTPEEQRTNIHSVVFIDENCEAEMNRFGHFLYGPTNLQQHLPEELKTYFTDHKENIERRKVAKKIKLCESVKLLGECNKTDCGNRHILDKALDEVSLNCENNPLINGKIKFKILSMNNVSYYTIKVIARYNLNDELVEQIEDMTEQITTGLMDDVDKMLPLRRPVVNHLYSYLDTTNYFYRCRVLDITKDIVNVKLIDTGLTVKTDVKRLFSLPAHFKDVPEQSLEIFLANLIPPHMDTNFSSAAYTKTNFFLDSTNVYNMTFTGVIQLRLGNTLWLNNVEEEREMFDKTLPTCGVQLVRELLAMKFVMYSEVQLKSLYKLCCESGIELPRYEMVIKSEKRVKEVVQVKPQWAFLDMEGVNEVTFSSAISPDEVYLKLRKFSEQLTQLERDITEDLKKPFYPQPRNIVVDKCYLVKDPATTQYCRAIIRQIENAKALCFFVDYGDETIEDLAEIKHINNEMITKLPFQAIQCRLHGIKSKNTQEVWMNNATDVLYSYSLEPDNDVFRVLYAKVCCEEHNEIIPRQKRYSILLKDGISSEKLLINQVLVESKFADLKTPDEDIVDFDLPIDEGQCEEYEEDDDEYLRKVLVETVESKQEDGYTIMEVNEVPGLEGFEFFGQDPKTFLQSLFKKPEPEAATTKSQKAIDYNFGLPVMKAAPPVDYLTPNVLWSQTDTIVKVRIKIPDVQEYKINLIKQRFFSFSTMKNDKRYELKLSLFETVAKTFQHTAIGQEIRITFTKIKNDVEWPRLQVTQQRMRNIRYDITAIKMDDEKQRKFLDLGISDSDNESSCEESGDMYVVHSDLDSDYDEDIPNCDY